MRPLPVQTLSDVELVTPTCLHKRAEDQISMHGSPASRITVNDPENLRIYIESAISGSAVRGGLVNRSTEFAVGRIEHTPDTNNAPQLGDQSDNTFSVLAMEAHLLWRDFGRDPASSCSSIGSSTTLQSIRQVNELAVAISTSLSAPSERRPLDISRHLALSLAGSDMPANLDDAQESAPPLGGFLGVTSAAAVRPPPPNIACAPMPFRERAIPLVRAKSSSADCIIDPCPLGKRLRREDSGGGDGGGICGGGELEEWSVGPGAPFQSESPQFESLRHRSSSWSDAAAPPPRPSRARRLSEFRIEPF